MDIHKLGIPPLIPGFFIKEKIPPTQRIKNSEFCRIFSLKNRFNGNKNYENRE